MSYTFVQDLTSDVMFEVRAKTLKATFTDAAKALFELTCQTTKIQPKTHISIKVTADTLKHLLQDFLNEIIAQIDITSMHFCAITIHNIDERSVEADLHGQDAFPELGETVAKAVSNYKFSIKETSDGYQATVVIDI